MKFSYILALFISICFFTSCSFFSKDYKAILLINISDIDREELIEFIEKMEETSPKVISVYGAFPFKGDSVFYKKLNKYTNIVTHLYLQDSISDYKSIYPNLSPKTHGVTYIDYISNESSCIQSNIKVGDDNFYHYLVLTCFLYDSVKTARYLENNDNLICFDKKNYSFRSSVFYEYKSLLNAENLRVTNYILYLSNFDSSIKSGHISKNNLYDFIILSKISEILGVDY